MADDRIEQDPDRLLRLRREVFEHVFPFHTAAAADAQRELIDRLRKVE
jgi:hypothetical protein